jgi:hypothetical protein
VPFVFRCGCAQPLFQLLNPNEQFCREHRTRVAEAEIYAQSSRAREQARILTMKQRGRRCSSARLDQPQRYKPGDELWMQSGLAGEGGERD